VALAVFSVALAVFGTTYVVPVAFATVFVLGAAYFVIVTALSTTLQMRVPDEVRGRVMGLWMMAWAGLVPLGGLIAGPIIDTVGISAVLLAGAVVAAGLATFIDLRDPELAALGAE
jgi:predicted MFS family arabinose efflux permease